MQNEKHFFNRGGDEVRDRQIAQLQPPINLQRSLLEVMAIIVLA